MRSLAQFVIPFVILQLIAMTDVSYAGKQDKGSNEVDWTSIVMQTTDVMTGSFSNLIKQVAFYEPPPTETFGKGVMQAVLVVDETHKSLIRQLAYLFKQSAGMDDKSASSILKTFAKHLRYFTKVFHKLLDLIMKDSQTGAVDNHRAKAIMETVRKNNEEFTSAFRQVSELMEELSGTEGSDNGYAEAVMQATGKVTDTFSTLLETLASMPPSSAGCDEAYIDDVLKKSDAVIDNYKDLIKQVTNMPKPSKKIEILDVSVASELTLPRTKRDIQDGSVLSEKTWPRPD